MLSSLVLILTMCGSGYAVGLETLSQPAITALHSGHNKLRSPLKLPVLVWNSTLVSVAGRNVEDCHPLSPEGTSYASYPKITDDVELTNKAIASWSAEARWVDSTWTCLSNWLCHNYSQIVWRNTTSVGCVIFKCRVDYTILKCEYYPPGSIKGEIPY